MTNKVYEELPSGAIDYLELDYDLSNVKIIYKSNKNKQYHLCNLVYWSVVWGNKF